MCNSSDNKSSEMSKLIESSVKGSARLEGVSTRIYKEKLDLSYRLSNILNDNKTNKQKNN